MERIQVSLKKYLVRLEPKAFYRRGMRKDLILFLDLLALQLRVGFDLAYAWQKTAKSIEAEVSEESRRLFFSDGSISQFLKMLSENYPIGEYRYWFEAISQLYESGAPMIEAIEAFALTLRREESRDLEAHCGKLPTKINILLILFFLPPTFLLLFVPLILEMQRAISN